MADTLDAGGAGAASCPWSAVGANGLGGESPAKANG